MSIIGIGAEVVNVTGEGNLWRPQDDKFDALHHVWNARADDRRKRPDGDELTVRQLVGRFVRILKATGVRPNPADPESAAGLAAVLTLLADEVWSELSYQMGGAVPATAAELGGPSRGDGAELWRMVGGRLCVRFDHERGADWSSEDQWRHAIRQAAWQLLGIPADSWEAKPAAPAKLRDLLAANMGEPAPPPVRKRQSLRDRARRGV